MPRDSELLSKSPPAPSDLQHAHHLRKKNRQEFKGFLLHWCHDEAAALKTLAANRGADPLEASEKARSCAATAPDRADAVTR